jgi:REP element-mobilizing transposase RayT
MMRDVLFHFDGERYDIHAWVIMPNHVHLLLNCRPEWDLSKILHSIKSFSSKQANALLDTSGKFWQTESYDHIVRNEQEYNRIIKYIVENPERAQMNDWPWVGSAGILPAAPAGEDACATWSRLIPDAGNT